MGMEPVITNTVKTVPASFVRGRGISRELAQVLLYENGLQWLFEIRGDLGRLAGRPAIIRLGINLGGGGNRVRDQIDAAHASAVEAHFVNRVVLGVHWWGYLLHQNIRQIVVQSPRVQEL